MKAILCMAFFLVAGLVETTVPTVNNGELKVQFNNVNVKNEGTIYIVLYDKEENFMTQNFFKSSMVKVEKDQFVVHFEDIPFGTYAVSAYHDINGNQQMDFNENGMPVEDYAMSGEINPMGPPSWNNVKFSFTEDQQLLNVNF